MVDSEDEIALDDIEEESLTTDPVVDFDDSEPEISLAREKDPPERRLIKLIIEHAVNGGATDIYFEPGEALSVVRYRTHGVLEEIMTPPTKLNTTLINELLLFFGLMEQRERPRNLLAKIKKAKIEHDFVSTGQFPIDHVASARISYRTGVFGLCKRAINLCLSVLPSHGIEQYHIEIFDSKNIPVKLDEQLKGIVGEQNGLVLLSSPADHGKTTTMYQLLRHTRNPGNVAVLVERKPAYPIAHTRLIVDPSSPAYEQTLRALRTYCPDILCLDDVTDERTAREALHYATNETLVFLAVTARDIAGSLDYLVNTLGINQESIAENLVGAVSQRLCRVVKKNEEDTLQSDSSKKEEHHLVPVYQVVDSKIIPDLRKALISNEYRKFLNTKPCLPIEDLVQQVMSADYTN